MMQGLPVGLSHVGHASEALEILDRRSFRGGAIFILFFPKQQCLSTIR